jgi:hypothetical protein
VPRGDKLAQQFHEQKKHQSHHDSTPPRQREGKQQVFQEGNKEKQEEMSFQDAKTALNAIYGHSDSDSNTDEHREQLHVMYGGS